MKRVRIVAMILVTTLGTSCSTTNARATAVCRGAGNPEICSNCCRANNALEHEWSSTHGCTCIDPDMTFY